MNDKNQVFMRRQMNILSWLAIAFFSVVFMACDSDDKNARLQVWLTDAPGDYDEVNIEVIGVEVHVGEGENESGWKTLDTEAGIYNLLELTNGLDTLLGEIEIPAGKISQIRLKLGDENTIRIGEEVFDLSTPSGQQSGLKLQVHETLSAGITYKILLDFDVAKSIVLTGNGTYKLKPVIRTITEAQDGAIKGKVDPKESTPAVYAIQGTDTVATTFSDSTGAFLIRGLAAGSYDVSIVPNSAFQPMLKEDVTVSLGNVTDLGIIAIE
jgi:hypothetical protein